MSRDLLQWGHALPGVETCRCEGGRKDLCELQWGHALPGVETGVLCGQQPR